MKKLVVKLGTRKKKHNVSQAHREKLRERMAQPKFKANREEGVKLNPEGHNQHTHPKGAKLLTDAAVELFLDDLAPDEICHAAGIASGSTWAACIARQYALRASLGSLEHGQFLQDCTEKKMRGPNGGSTPAVLNKIQFVTPK